MNSNFSVSTDRLTFETVWARKRSAGTPYNRIKPGWLAQFVIEDWFTAILLPKLKKKIEAGD